jgi:hypothetical protein
MMVRNIPARNGENFLSSIKKYKKYGTKVIIAQFLYVSAHSLLNAGMNATNNTANNAILKSKCFLTRIKTPKRNIAEENIIKSFTALTSPNTDANGFIIINQVSGADKSFNEKTFN